MHGEPAEEVAPGLDSFPRRDVDADRVVEVEFVHHLLDRLGLAPRRMDADDGQAVRLAAVVRAG